MFFLVVCGFLFLLCLSTQKVAFVFQEPLRRWQPNSWASGQDKRQLGDRATDSALSTAVIASRRFHNSSDGRASVGLEPYHLHLMLTLIQTFLRSNKILKLMSVRKRMSLEWKELIKEHSGLSWLVWSLLAMVWMNEQGCESWGHAATWGCRLVSVTF